MMKVLRFVFRVLQRLSPRAAARLAERVFFTPHQSRLSEAMRAALARGKPFSVDVEGCRVNGWTWGSGPVVYLVHGWGSRGGRLTAYVQPLVEAGFQVVTYDGIGHGSSAGRLSSMPQLARTLRAVVNTIGPAHGLVGHSLGASASVLAMEWGLEVGRAAFVAPTAEPVVHTLRWAERLGLESDVIAHLRTNSERRIHFSWSDLDIVALARRRTIPLLVVHDADDSVIPAAEGAAIAAAWPGSLFLSTRGYGHSDVVRAPEVVAPVVLFLANQLSREAASVLMPSATRSASAMIVR